MAMKQKIMITIAACVAYCINKELYQAIDCLRASKLVLKFKKQNPRWGYQKIADQISYLGSILFGKSSNGELCMDLIGNKNLYVVYF